MNRCRKKRKGGICTYLSNDCALMILEKNMRERGTFTGTAATTFRRSLDGKGKPQGSVETKDKGSSGSEKTREDTDLYKRREKRVIFLPQGNPCGFLLSKGHTNKKKSPGGGGGKVVQ